MKTTLVVVTCDRCGKDSDPESGERGWGSVIAVRGGKPGIYAPNSSPGSPLSTDVCPKCMDELYEWWDSARKEKNVSDHHAPKTRRR